MSILLWITIEMEYKIKCLKFILFFTNGRQKVTAKGLNKNCMKVPQVSMYYVPQDGLLEP